MTPEEHRRVRELQRARDELSERVKALNKGIGERADTIERLQRENAALRESIELCSGSCRLPVSTGE